MAPRIQDRIRDSLTNRGIQGGIVRRAIEQTGLASLGSELGTSQRIQEVAAQKQRSSSLAKGLISRAQALRRFKGSQGTGRGGFDPNKPQGIVVATPGSGQPGAGTDTGKPKFGITVNVGGTGQKKIFRFNDFGALKEKIKELQAQGIQIVLPGSQQGLETSQFQELDSLGIFRRSDVATQSSFLGGRRKGLFEQLSAINRIAGLTGGQKSGSDILADQVINTSSGSGVRQ